MSRFFFDIYNNGSLERDGEGVELTDLDAVRRAAMVALPDIAREDISKDGDFRSFVMLIKDDSGFPVHLATLTYTGHRLVR